MFPARVAVQAHLMMTWLNQGRCTQERAIPGQSDRSPCPSCVIDVATREGKSAPLPRWAYWPAVAGPASITNLAFSPRLRPYIVAGTNVRTGLSNRRAATQHPLGLLQELRPRHHGGRLRFRPQHQHQHHRWKLRAMRRSRTRAPRRRGHPAPTMASAVTESAEASGATPACGRAGRSTPVEAQARRHRGPYRVSIQRSSFPTKGHPAPTMASAVTESAEASGATPAFGRAGRPAPVKAQLAQRLRQAQLAQLAQDLDDA